jgi:hypothetical protein
MWEREEKELRELLDYFTCSLGVGPKHVGHHWWYRCDRLGLKAIVPT